MSPCQRERLCGWLTFKLGKGGPPNYKPDNFKGDHGIRDSSEELPSMFIDHIQTSYNNSEDQAKSDRWGC